MMIIVTDMPITTILTEIHIHMGAMTIILAIMDTLRTTLMTNTLSSQMSRIIHIHLIRRITAHATSRMKTIRIYIRTQRVMCTTQR